MSSMKRHKSMDDLDTTTTTTTTRLGMFLDVEPTPLTTMSDSVYTPIALRPQELCELKSLFVPSMNELSGVAAPMDPVDWRSSWNWADGFDDFIEINTSII
jgi:hypothetical protein